MKLQSHRHMSFLTSPTAMLSFVLFVASAEAASVHAVKTSMQLLQAQMHDLNNSTNQDANFSQAQDPDRRSFSSQWQNPMICASWDVNIDGSRLQDVSWVNFFEKRTGNLVFHMSVRPNDQVVVFNSMINDEEWQWEEREHIPHPLAGHFHISPADEKGWLVQFSDRSGAASWKHTFKHRETPFASGPGELGYEITTTIDPAAFTQTCLKTQPRFPGTPLADMSEVNDDDYLMVCPAEESANGHCLHVGGNAWDVRLWGHPSDLERVASRSGTWPRSSWKIARTHEGKTVRFESGAKGWEGHWLYWNLLYYSVWTGTHTEEEEWEFYPEPISEATNGLAAWTFRLAEFEKHTPDGLAVKPWARSLDWLHVHRQSQGIVLRNYGTVFNIFKVTPAPPTGAQPADFSRGKFFRICTSPTKGLCLVNYGGAVHGWENPGEDSGDLRAHRESLWHVYRDWGEHFVIESAVNPGHLLHVDEGNSAQVTVHPTAPNEGSRWHLHHQISVYEREWYEITPSGRHTDKYLVSDLLPHAAHLGSQPTWLHWFIEELR